MGQFPWRSSAWVCLLLLLLSAMVMTIKADAAAAGDISATEQLAVGRIEEHQVREHPPHQQHQQQQHQQQQQQQQQQCPVTLPAGRCICRQGDCSTCPECAGCDSSLCIDPPAGSTILHFPVLTGSPSGHGRQLLQSTKLVDLQIIKEVVMTGLKKKKKKKKKTKQQPSLSAAATVSGIAGSKGGTTDGLIDEQPEAEEGSTGEPAEADTDDDDDADDEEATATAAAAGPAGGPAAVGPPGSQFTFQLAVELTNAFPGPASAVRVYDNLPSGLTATSVTEQPNEEACGLSDDGSRIACAWASIGPGDRKVITIKAKGLKTGVHTNCATVSTSSTDVNPGNDEDCATVVVQGACCTQRPASGSELFCADTTPDDCPEVDSPTLVQSFYPDTSCRSNPCKAADTGACCLANASGDVICASKLPADACIANGGVFGGVGSTCAQMKCSSQLPPGACCLQDSGICVDLAAGGEATCMSSGGTFYAKRKCRSIKNECSPPKTADLALVMSGPSDTVKMGRTFELVFMVKLSTAGSGADSVQQVQLTGNVVAGLSVQAVSEMPESGGQIEVAADGASFTASWRSMSVPGDGLRTVVASIKSSSAGGFLTTGRVTTTSPESSLANNKDFFIVDVQGAACVTEWRQCNPSTNDCCSGLLCEATYAGCKAGAYVCKARPNDACEGRGKACGGQTGKSCCKGLVCHWNYNSREGTCQPAGSCIPPNQPCANDMQVCRGSRCIHGRCSAVTPKMCQKKCSTYVCNLERRKNCDALYASAASL